MTLHEASNVESTEESQHLRTTMKQLEDKVNHLNEDWRKQLWNTLWTYRWFVILKVGSDGDRTHDLLLARPLHYPLDQNPLFMRTVQSLTSAPSAGWSSDFF